MILRKRKGMALITVVLISALLFVSIIGISAKVTSEKKVSVARSSSERALVAAETGLSQTLFDLRNVDFTESDPMQPTGVFHYLTVSEIKEIVRNPKDHITDCGEQEYPPSSTDVPYVTYHVKIKRLDDTGTWDPDTGSDGDKDVSAQVYALGTVYRNSTKADVIGRRVITTECNITYHKESNTTYGSTSGVFDYGLFSGTDISFNGGAQEVNGDIYTGGNIDLGNSPSKVRVNGGTAYAVGQISGNGQTTGGDPPQSGADEIPFPQLDVDYYKGLAYDFKTGQAPYDDSESGYANCTDPLVLAVVQSYLGSDNTGNTIDEIQTFYADLRDYSGAFLTLNAAQRDALWTYAKSIVYFVDGNASINGNFECQGTIVINGDLSINGGAEIDNGGGLAILVNGDIIRSNGNAKLNGLFYATGGITGNGTFECNGSIVTQDPIDLNGNYTVNYVAPDIDNPNTNITTEVVENGITQANQSPSSWREVSYDVFKSP